MNVIHQVVHEVDMLIHHVPEFSKREQCPRNRFIAIKNLVQVAPRDSRPQRHLHGCMFTNCPHGKIKQALGAIRFPSG
jgi:hypothetical protein